MITTHTLMLDEILEKIKTPEELASYIKTKPYFRPYIEQVVNDYFIDFDTVDVVVNREGHHRSLAGAFLLNRATSNMFTSIFLNKKTTRNLKLKQFKSLSEMLFDGESKILDHVLNKNLVEIYPTLTHEFISEALNIADDRTTTS